MGERCVQQLEHHRIADPSLLRILIELNDAEDAQRRELQTVSGRDLYFRIAASLLADATCKQQSLKLLSGRMTDRAMRIRIREFEALGLIKLVVNAGDARTKQVVPTEEFIKRLNYHTQLFKQLCTARHLMIELASINERL